MKRRPTFVVAVVFSVLTAAATLMSCKQGEGERCQITSDCEDGLVCGSSGGSGATMTCREPTPTNTPDSMQSTPDGGLDAMMP